MFNQKINHFLSENPDYLNRSLGAPYIKARDIHNCGTTVLKYNKAQRCGSIPLQTWCSKNVAVESFAMRPIVNSKEYFENIKKYLSELIMNDSLDLLKSGLKSEKYRVIDSFATEPSNSFLQAIELNITNRLIYLLGESGDKIDMFKNYKRFYFISGIVKYELKCKIKNAIYTSFREIKDLDNIIFYTTEKINCNN